MQERLTGSFGYPRILWPALRAVWILAVGPRRTGGGIGWWDSWVCAADAVTIALGDLPSQVAGYGTERVDTLDVCGDTDTGFGLLFNWNLLGDGEHAVIATVDGTELEPSVNRLNQRSLCSILGRASRENCRRREPMARAYSQDLRDRVIDAVEREGLSRRAAARRFGVSAAAAIKWLQRFHRTGARGSAGTGGHRPSKVQPHRAWVLAVVAAQPDITLAALAARLWTERGVRADTSMLSRFFQGEGISFKKKAW